MKVDYKHFARKYSVYNVVYTSIILNRATVGIFKVTWDIGRAVGICTPSCKNYTNGTQSCLI
jgi:hypothetical protein